MKKVKILYLIDRLEVGGTQRHLVQLITGLDRDVFEPRVCCLQRAGPIAEELSAKDIPLACLGLKRVYGVHAYASLRGLADCIEREGVDVVHSYLFGANLLGTAAARRAGVRAVASKRDMGLERGRVRKLASRWVNRHAHVVTAASQAVARYVLEEGGISGDKIRVIYDGVPDECFRVPDRRTAETLLAAHKTWRKDRLTVGVVAGLKPVKNHAGFLSAAKMALTRIPEAQFLIVGDGPLRKDLEAQAALLGIRDRTTFFGETAAPLDLLAAMDAFVLCSLHEGFPSAVLEAMAAGLAVIATINGGCPEIIRHGRNGFLVNPLDSAAIAEYMIRVLGSTTLRKAMGQAARETVAAKFTPGRMVEEFERLYVDILAPVQEIRRERQTAVAVMC
jgi:glycosyltransferase involved in cell wall biosynthesis